MGYSNHLNDVIRKSTFRLNEKYVDGFISPKGEWIPTNSHHHVEKALEIIDDIDNTKYYKKWLKKEKEQLNKYLKAQEYLDKGDKSEKVLKLIEIGWMVDFIRKDTIEKLKDKVKWKIKDAEEYIKDYNKELEKLKENGPLALFKKLNKNKGYDAAEFIIIHYGYIAVEGGYLLYNKAKRSQVLDYDITVETDENNRDVIVKLTDAEITEKIEKKQKELKSLAGWYSQSENRFHCPSGFPRVAYERWRKECFKVGLDPDNLIYNRW